MNLLDPNRPQIGHRPALLWSGRPVGAIPDLHIMPCAEGVTVSVCVAVAPNTGRWFEDTFMATALNDIIMAYMLDPESWLVAHLGWTYDSGARFVSQLSITELGDL